MVHERWGLRVTPRSLVSERDQNFRLTNEDGRKFVLKIANSAEDPLVTEFQIQALRHIAAYKAEHSCPVVVPAVVPDLDGRDLIDFDHNGVSHRVRIVTYLDGVPLGDLQPGDKLFWNLGAYLAHLGRALREFEHRGGDQSLLWDMKSAPRVRELLSHISDNSTRDKVSACLDAFAHGPLAASASMRSQVIHNDLNPDNVLIDPRDNNCPAGVIDFGDMLKSPLIFDLGVAASYLRALDGDPLTQISGFVAGYHSVTPLEQPEIDILPDLILVRLSTTITVLKWRESVRGPEDPYLKNNVSAESTSELFFVRLLELPRGNIRSTLRQVCASVDASR